MHFNFKHLSMVASTLIFIGCGGGGDGISGSNTDNIHNNGSAHEESNTDSKGKNITIGDAYHAESLGIHKKIQASISLGNSPKDLYILLTNHSKTQRASSHISHSKLVSTAHKKKTESIAFQKRPHILHTPSHIQDFNANIKTFLLSKRTLAEKRSKVSTKHVEKENKVVGDSHVFYTDEEKGSSTVATLRQINSNIGTSYGNKTLNIWVSNDSFGSTCTKQKCVTQSMVNALANTFLQTGADNDIYDWVTNVFGEEWTSKANGHYDELIPSANEINILLTDIDNDNSPSGGSIGYFWSKDNVKASVISGSNEKIMFYVDSVMFANGNGGWSINHFWPKEIVSTIAHEFQHMIHFYQKSILLDASSDVWINEMLSETTEDLVATKIYHTGPRGVEPTDGSAGAPGNTRGRYPLFNRTNTLSLTTWNNTLEDYSKVNAFGTFLIRNYGGAKVLHDIVHTKKSHEDAIEAATGKPFATLIKEWGIAVLLSDKEDLQDLPTYNTGDFTPNGYNHSVYQLGSINFFNYAPQPTIHTGAGTVEAEGNYYYKIGENLTGTVKIDLSLNGSTEATLIAK